MKDKETFAKFFDSGSRALRVKKCLAGLLGTLRNFFFKLANIKTLSWKSNRRKSKVKLQRSSRSLACSACWLPTCWAEETLNPGEEIHGEEATAITQYKRCGWF